jgi:RNA polymerase sigma-70 factor (ECF subfamily)
MDTDDALVTRLAHDLDGSFEALVRAHQDRLFSIAYRFLGDRHDAEEVTQDALVRVYRALGGYDPDRIAALRLRPWLATIVLNVCRTRTARRRIVPNPLSLDRVDDADGTRLADPVADATTSPSAVVEGREARRRWASLVTQLPPAYRAPIVLRHVDGLSYPELAIALDRPEGTVKAQVHRGLALLRTAFEAAERHEREEIPA